MKRGGKPFGDFVVIVELSDQQETDIIRDWCRGNFDFDGSREEKSKEKSGTECKVIKGLRLCV
jgi:hypothetical protein